MKRRYDIELRLNNEDMLAEIANRLTVTADSMEAQAPADLHNTKDVLDDGNMDIIQRLITRFVGECVDILYPFTKTPLSIIRGNANPDVIDEYVILLSFNDMRSETQVQNLKNLIYNYVVYRCYAEWLAMTMPHSRQYQLWEEKAQEVRENIVTALAMSYSPRRLRIKPHFY